MIFESYKDFRSEIGNVIGNWVMLMSLIAIMVIGTGNKDSKGR